MIPLRDYRNFSRGGGGGLFSDDESTNSAKVIVAEVLNHRSQGQAVTDAEVLSAHPELHEQLKNELRLADQIRQAMLAARRVTAPPEALPPLTDSDFDASVAGADIQEFDSSAASEELPRIPGYLLVDEVKHGGQAAVFSAIQETTQRKVAIKVMSGGPFAKSRHRVRFEREAKILATLDHPNIVTIIERGRTPDGSFFFVMPYIDGYSLDEFWTTQILHDANGLRELVQLFSKFARAVHEAHSCDIVHRDLKPSNVIVNHRGEPHVLDFGLARPVGDEFGTSIQTITVPGQIIGSLPWACPEQAAGQSRNLNAASDIYSIGVMLYQSLAGDFPYSLDGPIDQVLLRIRTQKIPAPSKHAKARKFVDRCLDAIALKCLAKLPGDRYASASSLAADLDNWCAGKPIQAGQPKSRSRTKLIAYAAIIALLAALTLTAWSITRQSHSEVYQLQTLKNSAGMQFVLIPAGVSNMGSPRKESGRNVDEVERQVVIAKPFYIATTPVTQEQYERVIHENPSKWRGADLPVGNISWLQAVDFCHRLSEMDHANYRLPTEAEWEYACRANNHEPFPDIAHPEISVFSIENSRGAVHPVGQKQPNAWGLYDMQGNMSQWCSDVYRPSPSSDRAESSLAACHVIRGGSALRDLLQCRAASRRAGLDNFQQSDLGFRLVRDR